MRERRLAGTGRIAAADQAGRADGVVRRAEGPVARTLSGQPPAGARDPRHLERLLGCERRHDRGKPARGQGLARPGRPDHQQAVAAGRGDLEGVAQVALPAQVGEVGARPPPGRGRAAGARAAAATSGPRPARAGGRGSRSGSPRCRPRAPPRGRSRPGRRSPPHRAHAPPRRSPARPRRRERSRRGPARRPCAGALRAVHASCPEAVSSAAAIARSIPGPALRRLAGARLATIRRRGNSKPQLASAARTRSRASRTAASGRPTTEKAGSPRWTSTSTLTGRAEMPSRVNVCAVASTETTLGGRTARLAVVQELTRCTIDDRVGPLTPPDLVPQRRDGLAASGAQPVRRGALASPHDRSTPQDRPAPQRRSSPPDWPPPHGSSSSATPVPATASSTSSRSTARPWSSSR